MSNIYINERVATAHMFNVVGIREHIILNPMASKFPDNTRKK